MAKTRRSAPQWRLVGLTVATIVMVTTLRASPLPLPPHGRSDQATARVSTLTSYANLFVGTDAVQPDFGAGNAGGITFPGAAWPFGMVQWSPDTAPFRLDHAGGYTYADSLIRGFSLTHLSGAGCPVYQDVPIMPIQAPPTLSPVVAGPEHTRYTAAFSHADEYATPGYYRVKLASGITVELSVTRRTGSGIFTYPDVPSATLLVDNGGSANGNSATHIAITGASDLAGSVSSGGFCHTRSPYTLYFVARFNRPFAGYGAWNGARLLRGARACHTPHCGVYVSFNAAQHHVIQVKVGLSFVSTGNAWMNLAHENAGWNFQGTRRAADAVWNGLLRRIVVAGGTPAQTRTFYTALYHSLLFPSTFSDVNGAYIGFDGRVHHATCRNAQGRTVSYVHYANYSGWDIYRSEIPLLALLVPDVTGDMMQSLVADAEQGGWLPKWPIANGQASVMVGDPADAIIADAYAFGARRFDTRGALRAMIKGATHTVSPSFAGYVERPGLEEYLARGYVTAERDRLRGTPAYVWGPAATTLEYALADFTIAQFAGALGARQTHDAYLRRAQNWQTLDDPATGAIEPRLANGRFVAAYNPAHRAGYVEGNGAQYTWMVPYDLRGLAQRMGGTARAIRRLDRFFTHLNVGPDLPYAFLGNEPSEGAPWAYDFLGAPWRTQAVVRRAILSLYSAAPNGLPGNDDLGQTSSWYVFGALGFYPAIPGVGGVVLGSPLFPRITLHLAEGSLTISAPHAAATAPYVHGLLLDGRPLTGPWLPVGRLAGNHSLRFNLGRTPDTAWGSAPADAPPSFAALPLHAPPN
jgi:predicted alpha-1,2-mannosidase